MGEEQTAPDGGAANSALGALLAHHPDAVVAAVDDAGRFVPMPPSVPVAGHPVAQATSALDLVQASSRSDVITAWERAKADGGALVPVVLAGGAGTAHLHLLDVRAVHGVFVAVLVPLDGDREAVEAVASVPARPPRLVRVRKSEVAVITDADPDVTLMLGWDLADFVGRRSLEFVHPDDQDNAIGAWMEVLGKPGATSRVRLRHKHADGRWVWVEIANRNALDTDGYVEGEMFDISEEMEAHEALRASEQLLRRLADALPVGVVQFDTARRLLYANDRLREILGAAPDAGEREMMSAVVDLPTLQGSVSAVLAGDDVDTEVRIDRLDGGGRRLCTLALRALTSPGGEVTGAVGALTDVTEAARLRAELERRATFDDLTGCVNRSTAMLTLGDAIDRSGARAAVVFVDLDGFKEINDRYGHTVGDALLVVIGSRLRAAVRSNDVVGRIGGDEFLAICADVADEDVAFALAQRIAAAIVEPVEVGDIVLNPRASVGVAWAGSPGLRADRDVLIAAADAAMYASKAEGAGRPVLAAASATARG